TKHKILDNYLVQTRWGRGRSKHIIECEVKYEINKPVFIIRFEDNGQKFVIESKDSSTKAANEYLQKRNPNTQAKVSGVHVFGLNATNVEKEREKKIHSHSFKPFHMLSESMKTKRFHAFSTQVDTAFKNVIPKFYNLIDQPALQELRFNVQEKDYVVSFHKNREKNNQHTEAITKIIDQSPISRDVYRKLAALQYELPHDHAILSTRKKINEEMSQQIPISILNITDIPLTFIAINESSDINDPEIEEEMLKYIGKAGYRHITDILLFLIPGLVDHKVLNINNPVIHICISGDSRNVGRKIKHVMITYVILDDISNLYNADYHHTIILCPGSENYDLLKKVTAPVVSELDNLIKNRLDDFTGIKWKI
ncbi:10931_t:CDS:2, partial [Racocetra fulgida]